MRITAECSIAVAVEGRCIAVMSASSPKIPYVVKKQVLVSGGDLTDGIIAPPETYVSVKYMPTNVIFDSFCDST